LLKVGYQLFAIVEAQQKWMRMDESVAHAGTNAAVG